MPDFDHDLIMRTYDRAMADLEWLARDTTPGWYHFESCPECGNTVFQQPNGYCHCLNCKWQTEKYMKQPTLRRIIACVHQMQRLHGWPRRRAIRFALAIVRKNPEAPTVHVKHPMSGETREYLTHRKRSTIQ